MALCTRQLLRPCEVDSRNEREAAHSSVAMGSGWLERAHVIIRCSIINATEYKDVQKYDAPFGGSAMSATDDCGTTAAVARLR